MQVKVHEQKWLFQSLVHYVCDYCSKMPDPLRRQNNDMPIRVTSVDFMPCGIGALKMCLTLKFDDKSYALLFFYQLRSNPDR